MFPQMNSAADSVRSPLMVAVLIALSACLFNPATALAEDDLITAARTGNIALAKKTVRRGGDVNAVGQYGRTVLHIAAVNNHAEMVAFLIEAGADVDKHEGDNVPPLIAMVSSGNAEISRLLLEAGADLTVTKGKWNDPIGVLADWSNPELAKLLKGYDVDINAMNEFGYTVAHRQTERVLSKLNFFVAKLIQNPAYDRRKELQEVLRIYRAFFDAGADPDARNKAGRTPLIMLARGYDEGVLEASRVLLDAGADPNIRDNEGKTALDIASDMGRKALMALLADRGGDPNADPLILFNAVTAEDRLRLLLEAGADPNAVAEVCVSSRAECRSGKAVKLESRHILLHAILRLGWRNRGEDSDKRIEKNLGIVRALLEAGSDPNTGTPKNALWSVLRALRPHPGLVELLLEFGATLEGMGPGIDVSSRGEIYLPHAPYQLRTYQTDAYSDPKRSSKRGVVAAFLDSGADPNDAHPETGMTPLRIAVRRGEIGIVRALINAGADVAGDNVDGTSILDAAIKAHDYNRNYPKAVCSGPRDQCKKIERFVNSEQNVKDQRTIIAELVMAGAVPAKEVGEDVRRHVVQAAVLARQARSAKSYLTVIREFEKARKLAPTWPDIYYKIAAVHEAGEDFPAALSNYEVYLALLPQAADRREVQDRIYELEVLAKSHVTRRDVLRIFGEVGKRGGGWRREGSALHIYGEFRIGDSGMMLHRDDGVTRRPIQIPVEIKGRTVRWRSVTRLCGGSPEYGECPVRMNNVCEVRSTTRIDCTIEYYNDWPRDNSGTGSNGGRRWTAKFSWVK